MLSDLAFGLAQDGIEVSVITSRLHYDGNDSKLALREMISGVDVRRIWTTRFGRSRLKLRAIDYLTFYISAAWTLLRMTSRGDIVVAMTDPPMLSVIAAPIVKMRGARLVNWLQDLFPEVADALYSGGKLERCPAPYSSQAAKYFAAPSRHECRHWRVDGRTPSAI